VRGSHQQHDNLSDCLEVSGIRHTRLSAGQMVR